MELTIEQALQQGVAAHNAGNLKEAERLYRAILQSQPAHPDANHNLGLIAVSVNKAVMALPLFKTALEAGPEIEQFWLSYIDALIKEQQFEAVKQVIQQAKKQGVDGEKLNVMEAQLASINKEENVDSLSPPQQQLSNILEHYQNGRLGEAEKFAVSVTQEFPRHPFSWKILGGIYKALGRMTDALYAVKKAVELDSGDSQAHNGLGVILEELERFDEAEASYRKAILLKPDDCGTHYNLGNAMRKRKKYAEAAAAYQQAIAVMPNYAEAHSNLGITLQELGRLDASEASCRQAIAITPDYADAHYNLGIALQALGRSEEAKVSYMQATALKPDFVDAHRNLGNTLIELGRLEEAKVSYMQAIALKPDFSDAHINLGQVLMKIGRHREGLNEQMIGGGVISFNLNDGFSIL